MNRLGAVALAFAGALGLAAPAEARRWVMENRPEVALVADLPDDAGFEGYSMDRGSVQLDLGWSYREVSALWMPFWAYEDQGMVLFSQNPDGSYMLAPVTAAELDRVKQVTGRDHGREYAFPRAAHLWGWLPMMGILGFILWLRRREAKQREALGVI